MSENASHMVTGSSSEHGCANYECPGATTAESCLIAFRIRIIIYLHINTLFWRNHQVDLPPTLKMKVVTAYHKVLYPLIKIPCCCCYPQRCCGASSDPCSLSTYTIPLPGSPRALYYNKKQRVSNAVNLPPMLLLRQAS